MPENQSLSAVAWADRAEFNYKVQRMTLDELVDEIATHGRLIGMNMGITDVTIYHSWYIGRCREELARRLIEATNGAADQNQG